jgi:hypothetical protein
MCYSHSSWRSYESRPHFLPHSEFNLWCFSYWSQSFVSSCRITGVWGQQPQALATSLWRVFSELEHTRWTLGLIWLLIVRCCRGDMARILPQQVSTDNLVWICLGVQHRFMRNQHKFFSAVSCIFHRQPQLQIMFGDSPRWLIRFRPIVLSPIP